MATLLRPGAHWLGPALVLGLLAIVFGPVFAGMLEVWLNDGDRAYGLFVSVFVAYLVWEQRGRVAELMDDGAWWGLAVVCVGLAALVAGAVFDTVTLERVALPLTAIGLCLFHLGTRASRTIAFALVFSFLMVPVPHGLYLAVAFPLQQLAAWLAALTLEGLGIAVFLEGNILHLPHAVLGVNEACSGIRSLFSLGVLSLAWSYLSFEKSLPRAALVLSVVPISVLTNSGRVVASGLTGRWFGRDVANGMAHDVSGWLVFLAALAGVAFVHSMISRFIPARDGLR
ncbi:MAG: exosortase/archaeosortase family protein [Myxococcota bacterium]